MKIEFVERLRNGSRNHPEDPNLGLVRQNVLLSQASRNNKFGKGETTRRIEENWRWPPECNKPYVLGEMTSLSNTSISNGKETDSYIQNLKHCRRNFHALLWDLEPKEPQVWRVVQEVPKLEQTRIHGPKRRSALNSKVVVAGDPPYYYDL
jgi:hypothetical protein